MFKKHPSSQSELISRTVHFTSMTYWWHNSTCKHDGSLIVWSVKLSISLPPTQHTHYGRSFVTSATRSALFACISLPVSSFISTMTCSSISLGTNMNRKDWSRQAAGVSFFLWFSRCWNFFSVNFLFTAWNMICISKYWCQPRPPAYFPLWRGTIETVHNLRNELLAGLDLASTWSLLRNLDFL